MYGQLSGAGAGPGVCQCACGRLPVKDGASSRNLYLPGFCRGWSYRIKTSGRRQRIHVRLPRTTKIASAKTFGTVCCITQVLEMIRFFRASPPPCGGKKAGRTIDEAEKRTRREFIGGRLAKPFRDPVPAMRQAGWVGAASFRAAAGGAQGQRVNVTAAPRLETCPEHGSW